MSHPSVFPSMPAQDNAFAELEARRSRRAAAQSQYDQGTVDRLNAITERAPWLPASAATALAQAGVAPDGPEVDAAMKAAARVKSKSGGWNPLGAVVKAGSVTLGAAGWGLGKVGRGLDTVLGGVDETAARIAKPVVRTSALTAMSGLEEVQGVVRNVAGAAGGVAAGALSGALTGSAAGLAGGPFAEVTVPVGALVGAVTGGVLGGIADARNDIKGRATWEPQSRGAVSLEQLLRGERVDVGSGFLPRPSASIEAEVKARQSVTIGGHAITPGRLLAAGVVDPGTKPYSVLSGLVDGSIALSKLDPASALGRVAGNVNRNRKLFTEAGLIGAIADRPAIVPEVAQAWWTGASDLRQNLADNGFYDIWKATKGKLGAQVTHELAQASTPEEVDKVIRPILGIDNALRGPLVAKFDTFRPFENVRLLKTMPGQTIDLRDADQSVATIEQWLQNAKAPQELIAKHTAAMAAAQTRVGRYEAATAAMDATRDLLVEKGWSESMAGRLTKMVGEASEDTRGFFVNAVGENVNVPGMWADGPVTVPKPHAFSEFLNRALPLPDARDVRAATSMFAPLLKNDALWTTRDIGTSTLDFMQGQVWKRAALLRGAYTVRVIGEEQLRMAASGLDSLVNHPMSLIAHRLSEDSVLGRAASSLGLDVGKGATDALGGVFKYQTADEFAEGMDDFNKALNREYSFNGWTGQKLPIWKKVQPGAAEFEQTWAEEIAKLANDAPHRQLARQLDEVQGYKDWFWGSGAEKLADAVTPGERYRLIMGEEAKGLMSRDVSDRYVDSMVDRLNYTTGGDGDLLGAIATGKLAEAPVRKGMKASPELRAYLGVSGDIAPEYLYSQLSLSERGGRAKQAADNATRWMFSNLMAERTNNLSRSPTFKQFYWQRAEELAPFMDDASKARLAASARANKLDDVATRIDAAKATGDLTVEAADHVAKGFALDGTRDLLYDMSERGQFFDAARLIFPFGEAWKEIITRWAKIGVERPQALRRAQQVISGARQSGFFRTNENGEEVFNYPASDWVSEKMFGVPVPLTGRVAGLSLMADVLPGVGPVVQIPASAFLPDKPDFDTMRSVIFPFGEPDMKQGVVESLLPAWVKKWGNASGAARDEGQWNATVLDVARFLASTGKYDTSSPDEMTRLLDDARSKAQKVYALRGAAQFFAPTAPTPEWIVQDKNGDALVAQTLIKEYQGFLKDDPNNALDRIFERYGEGIFLLLQGKTAEVTPAAPVTKEGGDWERSNAGLVKRFPNVYGFFAPSGGDLDLNVYGRQLAAGKRQRLTPEEALRLANDRVANAIYQNAKSSLGARLSDGQTGALRKLKEVLLNEYPGYTDRSGIPEKVSTDTLVRDLQRAAREPKLADNPVTAPLRVYLEARQAAADASEAQGNSPTSFRSANGMRQMRAALRALGAALVSENPAFAPIWDRVFDRELKPAEEEVSTSGQP